MVNGTTKNIYLLRHGKVEGKAALNDFGGQINLTYLLFAIMIYVQTLTVVTLIMQRHLTA